MTCVQWRRLRISPVECNDSHKLELPRAWEPTCSRRPLSLGEGKSSQGFVFNGNKKNCGRNAMDTRRLTLLIHARSALYTT